MATQIKAVVTTKDSPNPIFKEIQLQTPKRDDVVVKVLATGYHHLVKARASRKHYSVSGSSENETLVGVDGVGYINGTSDLVYFTAFEPGNGSYAEYVNVNKKNIYHFPKNCNSDESIARTAALSNGVMSSYFALGLRVQNLRKNPVIAVLGVTGTSGQLAIQVSKIIFGAKLVIGIGRLIRKLEDLKQKEPLLDEIISFEEKDSDIIKSGKLDGVDVVLDYLWGVPALRFMHNLIHSREDKTRSLSWVQIGLIAGEDVAIPSSYLRSSNFTVLGSGIGPLSEDEMHEIFKASTSALARGLLTADVEAVLIGDIEYEWAKPWDNMTRKYFVFDP